MTKELKTRLLKLKRDNQISDIELKCLNMEVGEDRDFPILDTFVHQRLRKRLCILRDGGIDMQFETELRKDKLNTITVTRKA